MRLGPLCTSIARKGPVEIHFREVELKVLEPWNMNDVAYALELSKGEQHEANCIDVGNATAKFEISLPQTLTPIFSRTLT